MQRENKQRTAWKNAVTKKGRDSGAVASAEDLAYKAASTFFGKELMNFFHIKGKIAGIAPTELVHLEVRHMYQDFNFKMENNQWFHFEFESDRISKKDLKRFREYEAITSREHDVDVVTHVICTANVKAPLSVLKTGINTYRIKVIRMRKRSADRLFARLQKEEKNRISKQDLIMAALCPLMGGKLEMAERIKLGFSYLQGPNENVTDEELKQMQAILYVLAGKFLSESEFQQMKGEFSMYSLAQEIMEDGIRIGESRGLLLSQKLIQDNRLDDWSRSITDTDYRERLCREYKLMGEED